MEGVKKGIADVLYGKAVYENIKEAEITTDYYKKTEDLYNDMCTKFRAVLPQDLKQAFDSICDMAIELCYTREEIGVASGLCTYHSLITLLRTPFKGLNELQNTYREPEDIHGKEINKFNSTITNYIEKETIKE